MSVQYRCICQSERWVVGVEKQGQAVDMEGLKPSADLRTFTAVETFLSAYARADQLPRGTSAFAQYYCILHLVL